MIRATVLVYLLVAFAVVVFPIKALAAPKGCVVHCDRPTPSPTPLRVWVQSPIPLPSPFHVRVDGTDEKVLLWAKLATYGTVLSVLLILCQLSFMKRQDNILFARAHLSLTTANGTAVIIQQRAPFESIDGYPQALSLNLENVGNSTAQSALVRIRAPIAINLKSFGKLRLQQQHFDSKSRLWVFQYDLPIYPRIPRLIDPLAITVPVRGSYIFYWQVSTEHGTFPLEDEWGELRFNIE